MNLSAKQASDFLGHSVEHVRRLLRAGVLAGEKIDGLWRLDRADVAHAVLHGLPRLPSQMIDRGRRLLYSHRELVTDLLLGFFGHEPWVHQLDFNTLKRVSGSYVSYRLDARFQDVVWTVKCRGQDLYICLLIEFQSTVDPYMAMRYMVYLGLFYENQVRHLQSQDLPTERVLVTPEEAIQAGETPARYPLLSPVIPITIYSGKPTWWAETNSRDLIFSPLPGLEPYLPNVRYHLLDEGRIPEGDLKDLGRNLAAAVVRLERCGEPVALGSELRTLDSWLVRQPELQRSFLTWTRSLLLREEFAGLEIPEEIQELGKAGTMLAENMLNWGAEQKQQGVRKGGANLLLHLMETKFGPLDDATRRRIEDATPDDLLRWADRILTARRLPEIFGDVS